MKEVNDMMTKVEIPGVGKGLKDYAANRRKTCSVSQAKKAILAFSYVFK